MMASYTVTKVRMESSDEGGRHEHIEGVHRRFRCAGAYTVRSSEFERSQRSG
jgi:hypothetical protein